MVLLKHLLSLAMLTIATQGVWAQTLLNLYNSSDNSSTIESYDEQVCDVTLSGRTLYQDGDWNTLCVPFDMDATQIAASPLAGTTIMALNSDASKTYLDTSGTLWLHFDEATSITAGQPYIVKWPIIAINNADDWDEFLTNMSKDDVSYKGKIVRLYTDITTSEMVGTTSANAFDGIFDGNGHTINCAIDYSTSALQSQDGVALFRYINNATIMNLRVEGFVYGYNHCAGLVGYALGTSNLITNCEVAVAVNCYAEGDETHCGGVLGNGTTSKTTISNSLFSGILTGMTSTVGIIYGWGETGGEQNISYCVAEAEYPEVNALDIIKGAGTMTVTSCFKNTESGSYGTSFSYEYPENPISDSDMAILKAQGWTDERKPNMTAGGKIENPVFSGVTIDATGRSVDNGVSDGYRVRFLGTYKNMSFDKEDKSILFLGERNTLYYPTDASTIGAQRAYFKIGDDTALAPARLTAFNIDFGEGDEATGITSVESDSQLSTPNSPLTNSWYTLDGRRLSGQPRTKGVYVKNGIKAIIK